MAARIFFITLPIRLYPFMLTELIEIPNEKKEERNRAHKLTEIELTKLKWKCVTDKCSKANEKKANWAIDIGGRAKERAKEIKSEKNVTELVRKS